MATSTLTQIWSIDKLAPTPDAPTPPNADFSFCNDILIDRWLANHVAHVITTVPSSETRLCNDGLIPMYKCIRGTVNISMTLAHKRGITLPSFPAISADWEEEAKLGQQTLDAELLPHMADPVKEYVNFVATTGNNHWTSLVTPISTTLDMFLSASETPKTVTEQIGVLGMVGMAEEVRETYAETLLGDKELEPYTEAMMDSELRECAKVTREEMMRVRSEAAVTGWREEETKEVAVEHLRLLRKFFKV